MKNLEALTLKQLRAFATVCETGSITVAAHRLSLTAPAVHTQLKSLESILDSKLLNRDRHEGMSPTEAGRAVLKAQAKVFAAIENAGSEISAINRGLRGFVRLGVVSTGKYFAPYVVAHLNRTLPDVEIDLLVGNRTHIVDALAKDSLDFAIMGRPPRLPGVRSTSLGPHPHVLITRPDDPLAHGDTPRAADILKSRFILREEGSGTRILAIRFLDRIGEGQTYSTMVLQSNETIKQAVRAGLGIALISLHTVLEELKDGRLVVLNMPSLPVMRNWYLVEMNQTELMGASKSVYQEINASARSFLHTSEIASILRPGSVS